jgi:Leucine-rich repeat (LRR) protein
MKKIYFLVLALCVFNSLRAQVVNIPDANFKAKLLQADETNEIAKDVYGFTIKIDINNNKEIEVSEAASVGYLTVTASQLSTLEGISSFSNLKSLLCGFNSLKNLDVKSLTKLQYLKCDYNLLTSLEINGLSELTNLFCNGNQLTSLNMGGLNKMQLINCEYNKLIELDLTSLSNLSSLNCSFNTPLTSLKVSGLAKLKSIDCEYNTLSTLEVKNLSSLERLNCHSNFSANTLDLTGLPNLSWLNCDSNKLTTLDVSGLTKLSYLSCAFNQLITLDASSLKNLTYLSCSRNKLTNLNVNGLGFLATLYVSDNNLTSFTGTGLNSIKTLEFRNNKLTNLDVTSSTSLESLFCDGNLLTNLNVTGLNNLKLLTCNSNKLTSLDVASSVNLKTLHCNNNLLTTINVKNSNTLNELYCETNQLTSIDLTGLNNLKTLACSANKITDINILGLKNLSAFYCTSNLLTKIDLTGLNMLTILACGRNQLPSLNVLGLSNLNQLYCHHNLLTGIDLTGLKNLNLLSCGYNQLSSLNVTDLTNLKDFYCTNNQIKDLNLTGLTNLGLLECGNNLLTKLNVSGLKKLNMLSFENNAVDAIDLNGLQNIISFNCSNNKLTTLDFSGITYSVNNNFFGQNYEYIYADGTGIFMTSCEYKFNDNLLTIINLKNSNEFYAEFKNNSNLQYICVNDDKTSVIQESITQYGYVNCTVNSYCSFTPGGVYYTIQGNNRFDNNNNGCDASDIAASNIKFTIADVSTTGTVISNKTGAYSFPVKEGKYIITPIIENSDYFTISPTSVNVTFPTNTNPFLQDFCITPIDNHKDLEITLIPLEVVRPGFDTKYKIVYKNKGNAIQSGTVNLVFDDAVLDVVISNPLVSSQNTNNLSWNFTNLNPFETREISFTLNANTPAEIPAVNNGDVLKFSTNITSQSIDENPADNIFVLNQTVVGSFDPNDKTCLEGDIITPSLIGQYVHYMIRFENKGTYPAQNIVVKDMIDLTKFDISTLIPTSSSHSFVTKISEGNKVEFIFENINLPFDDVNNDGYISFKIKTKPTLKVGDSFDNEANIYFDYNFPVLTNKATSTFKTTLNTSDFEFSNYFSVYPIPANEVLNISAIQNIEIQSIAVYDILGQLVISLPNVKDASKIDVSNLRTGNYFLNIKSDKGSSNLKFIKN